MRVTHRLRRFAGAPYRKYGWPAAQVRLLLVVESLGDRPRMGEVKESLGLTGRAVTSAVDALERDGLLTREPDPTDRRASLLAITEAGRERLTAIKAIAREHSDTTWQILTPSERQQFLTLLLKVDHHLDDDL